MTEIRKMLDVTQRERERERETKRDCLIMGCLILHMLHMIVKLHGLKPLAEGQ